MKKIAFTLVLNGMNFLPNQYKIIPKMFDKWYIIEGPVTPTHCTSWCKNISNTYLNNVNMSNDGTYEYLNSIKNDKIQVIRPEMHNGKYKFWDGKLEMCNSFMDDIEDCILMQIDMDEFWSEKTLTNIFNWCYNNQYELKMSFKCNFFVGENLITYGNNCYGDKSYEWDRLWVIKNKTKWLSHEPPKISTLNIKHIDKNFTFNNDWGFLHYAYVNEDQLKFKENYYGYTGAVDGWKRLNNETKFPVYLKDYFSWVNDNTLVIKI